MDKAQVLLEGSPIAVERTTFQKWFPRLGQQLLFASVVEADNLMFEVASRLVNNTTVPIETEDVRKTLEKTFRQMGLHFGGGFELESTGDRNKKAMAKLLREDTSIDSHLGLYRSRKQFLILCIAAQREQSQRLAQALIDFLSEYVWHIVDAEDQTLLCEWCLGVMELQGLIIEPLLQHMIHQLAGSGNHMTNGWRKHAYHDPHTGTMMRMLMEAQQNPYLRGRAPLALGGPAEWYPRARSLPLVRRRRSRDLRIGLPMLPSSALTSPVMSPTVYPRAEYLDEVKNLQYQNVEMNAKLDNIGHKVDLLVYGAV
jgi:hypothetical protein